MPQVPIIEQEVRTQALSTPRIGASLRPVENAFNDATVKAGERAAQGVMAIADMAKKRGDEVALIDAQRQLDDWEAQNLYSADGAFNRKGKDAFGLPAAYGSKFDEQVQKMRDSFTSAEVQTAFEKMTTQRRGTLMKTLYEQERNQMNDYAKNTVEAAVDSSINRGALFFSRPEIVDESIKNAQESFAVFARQQGMPDEEISNKMLDIESKTRLTVLNRMADESPKAAMDYYKNNLARFNAQDLLSAQRLITPVERKYKANEVATDVIAEALPKVSRDEMIDFVISTLEGGDKVITDSNGAIAKFGVNKEANPDVDVAGLTYDGAAGIATERYWKKIDADNLPMDMRLPALSFAFTSGVAQTKELLKEAGGDARKFNELAAKFYSDLATKNPEKYGQYLEGWNKRLAKVNAQVDLMRGKLPDELELSRKVDSLADDVEIATDAKSLVSTYLKNINESRKQSERAASDEAWEYVSSGREVPPTVQSRMNPKELSEMRDKSEPDPALYNDLRNRVLLGQDVDLAEYRWRLGGKYGDLLQLQQDPTKRSQTRTVNDIMKSATGLLLGKASAKTPDDFKRLDQFERAVQVEVDAYQKSTNKIASPEEVQKITDRMLLSVDTGLFSSKRMFELKPGESFEVDGVPRDRKIIVGGEEQNYDDVINLLTTSLSKRGKQVTEESVSDLFNDLVERKAIVVKYNE